MPRFTPDFLDEIKARLRPSDVIGRYVKLRKQGHEWVGLSPFTQEKSPSFFVNDQKGFYHCFSSGKHGDVISFLMETQKLPFHEAVARLAEEAGLQLPAEDPQEAQRAEKRKGLAEACGEAARYFAAMLRRADGRPGAEYLKGRAVTKEQVEAFSLGYAPESRTGLKDYLINKGYTDDVLVEAGLLIRPDDGGPTYDRFRHRVMFPILGSRDEVIAFGGRALDPNARAKYLNSPETPLFHKGGVLYNYGAARKAAGDDGKPLIVCEGYMDVIALWGAGVKRAVAPLGTALTENQLALLWRVSDEPVLCFDGDKAGIGAAFRSIDRALPMLKPGKSLSFAFLPNGQDPDDLIRSGGASAFNAVLDDSKPLVDVLWRRETEARPLDTPERRAALRAHLRELVKLIADNDVRAAYGAELARRLDEAFAPPARAGGEGRPAFRGGGAARRAPSRRSGKWEPPPPWGLDPRPSPSLKRAGAPSNWAREASLVLTVINHPPLAELQEGALMGLELQNTELDILLRVTISAISADPALDSASLKGHLGKTEAAGTLERVLRDEPLNRQTFLRPGTEIEEVERGWCDALRRHLIATDSRREVAESASQSFSTGDDIWKAAVTAREELINLGGDGGGSDEPGASAKDLSDRLERLRKSVQGKTKR